MARPEKNNVDYFPFICEEGKKMYCIEEAFGNDGFASFVKILRELAKKEYHYLDLSDEKTLMYLSAKCKVDKEKLLLIVNYLVDLEKFDRVLWDENKVIWCQDFIDSIQDAYIKRKNECITYEGLFALLLRLGVRKPTSKRITPPVKPQSIVEDSKEKKTKVNPSFKEVEDYGKEKGYNLPVQKIIDHYTDGGNLDYWIDAKNKKVLRWKSKVASVWFQSEIKIKNLPKEYSDEF